MKFNKTMLWPTLGILAFGIFAIIGIEGIGYRFDGYVLRLNDFDTNYAVDADIYGLGVAGLVFAWVFIIIPCVQMFTNKMDGLNKILPWVLIGFESLALILLIASISLFANKSNANGGAVFGQLIFVIIGYALAFVGTWFGYIKPMNLGSKSKAVK